MSITYDKAGTANIEWAGQSLAALIDGEAGGAYELSSSFAGKTVKLKIDNLGIMEKDVISPEQRLKFQADARGLKPAVSAGFFRLANNYIQ